MTPSPQLGRAAVHAHGTLTDLYQLTMLAGYLEQDMHETAVFEFFVRRLPRRRGFLLAAGLEQALDYLLDLRFTPVELAALEASGRFDQRLLDYLQSFRFSGDVHAMAEGTPFFADEPILRVTAPLPQAQLVESRLVNLLHFQTVVASKAARMVLSAPDMLLVDFKLRRAHGAEAGLLAARAAYLAGFAGSATVLAESAWGVPAFGTMAHSFVQAHDDEETAFRHFARAQPDNLVLLIDTYDTEAGAEKVVHLAPQFAAAGSVVRAVRIDSGDLAAHAGTVRGILDAGGLTDVRIFVSGSVDEYLLADFVRGGAPIDGAGVGTRLTTSADAPYLDCAYKLQEYASIARRKRSVGKATWPGRKQVWRERDETGRPVGDVLTVEGDTQSGEALVREYLRAGERLAPPEPLAAIRERARAEIALLPVELRRLQDAAEFPVEVAPALHALATEVDARTGG